MNPSLASRSILIAEVEPFMAADIPQSFGAIGARTIVGRIRQVALDAVEEACLYGASGQGQNLDTRILFQEESRVGEILASRCFSWLRR
jgi:hypothetical protein